MTVPFGTDVKVTLIPKIGEDIVPKETIKHLKVCVVRENSKKGFTPIYKVGDAGIDIEIQRHRIKYPGVYKIILDWRRPDAAYYDGYQDISNSCSFINFSTSCKVVRDNTADIEISPNGNWTVRENRINYKSKDNLQSDYWVSEDDQWPNGWNTNTFNDVTLNSSILPAQIIGV